MPTIANPVVGDWYLDLETHLSFKVVGLDELEDSIEVQYLNGDVGDYDLENWYASPFEPIEAPEDWSAPYDEIEPDDLGYSDPDIHTQILNTGDVNDLLKD